jgi:molybdenum cofactor synthesis domain-containing protein
VTDYRPGVSDPRVSGGTRWRAKVLTVSDGVVDGTREDKSGAALADRLAATGFEVVARQVSPDGTEAVSQALRELADGFAGLIVTTGGTGFGPRDLTPEGTRAVLQREAPGLAEAMRLASPLGRLSRATAGTIDRALVLNTPGSPTGAVECLDAVIDVVPHALDLLSGGRPH